VKRQSRRGQAKALSDPSGGHAVGTRLHEQAENIEPGLLGERRERNDGDLFFHISKDIEILKSLNQEDCQTPRRDPRGKASRTGASAPSLAA
jgi:hypothetical protein